MGVTVAAAVVIAYPPCSSQPAFGASATFKPALDKACCTGEHYPMRRSRVARNHLGPGFPMIRDHHPSNAGSRQGKSRAACPVKNHPELNCAEALNVLLRPHRLA